MKKAIAIWLSVGLSALLVWTGEAACKSCRRASSSSNARTIRVSCKVGENATPAKQIGIKQSFEGEVARADGDVKGGGRTTYGYAFGRPSDERQCAFGRPSDVCGRMMWP